MAVGIRRSALSMWGKDKDKESKLPPFKELFNSMVSSRITTHHGLDDKCSQMIFLYGKNSKNRTRHFKESSKVKEFGDYDARLELITLHVFPESEVERIEKEAEEHFKKNPNDGDHFIIPDTDDMISLQRNLIMKYLPDYYIRMNQGHFLPDKEVFVALGIPLDNQNITSVMSKVYEVIREQPNDSKSKILEFKEIDEPVTSLFA